MDIKPPVICTPATSHTLAIGDNPEAWLRLVAREATYWTYLIRNRRRWIGTSTRVDTQRERAAESLNKLGLNVDQQREIAKQRVAEVCIPFAEEAVGWEVRIFPWEYVLSSATSDSVTVLRHLVTGRSRAPRLSLGKVLYVESTPGGIGKSYTFDSEEALVRANLGADSKALRNPTPERLSIEIERYKPDIVHLAGFDSHQGRYLQDRETPDRKRESPAARDQDVYDGYMMSDDQRRPMMVDASTLGKVLVGKYHKDAKGHRPSLVGCSFWNSGARVAAMAVAAGVKSAVGFQDSLDDELIELFFGTFYRSLGRKDCDIPEAFETALRFVHEQPGVGVGSGLILWNDRQAVVQNKGLVKSPPLKHVPLTPLGVKKVPLNLVLEVKPKGIQPCPELNYSALHNRQPLFDSFTLLNQSAALNLKKDVLCDLADVDVRVVLSAGSETACFERRLTVNGPVLDLRKEVHVPLTSELLRSARETVNSSMLVEVKWGDGVIYRDTHPVRLLPIDQWRDNESDGLWLPSFVLPRDPAVVKLIEKAQRYVRVLRDDPSSGFDGYQSIDTNDAEPYAEVDLQVQAIWSTVIHELELGYVNPPPAYSNKMDSQRLRTPSMTIGAQCGTCIDLALLMAACLELVDIYPVIFLLNDHAFPGYWRSPEAHESLVSVNVKAEQLSKEDTKRTQFAGVQRHSWWLKGSAYDEIIQQVKVGNLVPLESVWLTEHSGFWEAVEGGRENLGDQPRFHSLLDIARAREANVTPIPVWGSHA